MARFAPVVRSTPDAVPLVPVQVRSSELPATTVGEWRRRRFLRRHKGGPWTVPLTFCHHVSLQGGFLVSGVLRRGGQSPRYRRRNRTRCGFGGHGSLLQEWSAPLNGAVLGVRRLSKATLLEHQRRNTPGISYDEVSPARQETC